MRISFMFLAITTSLLISCGGDGGEKRVVKDPMSSSQKKWEKLKVDAANYFAALPTSAENPNNIASQDKINLGHALYFDNRLSKNQTQSCNTCHDLNTFGVDNKAVSDGDDGHSKGTRNSPTTLNSALHVAQFWDGRAKDVEEQAGMPILNPVEMNIPNEAFLVKRLSKVPFYQEMFSKAFPGEKNPINYNNIQLAIGAFERQLLTPSRFDKYLAGDDKALSDIEKEGLQTFIEQSCTTCHTGVLVGGSIMQKFPLVGKYEDYLSGKVDYGKYEVSKNEMDRFYFKVPSLRNVTKTAPYLHDGSKSDLAEVVKIMGKAELGKDISDDQANKIIAFLGSLEGELDAKYKTAPAILTN